MSNRAVLEVIALDAEDAVAAQAGGADRLELVTDMAADGLTPSRATFAAIRAAVDIPLRVMLRVADGFAAGDIDVLVTRARELRSEGADEFVFGFLDADGRPDLVAVERIIAELDGCHWTFHRAIDRAADRDALRKSLADLPGLDTYLTAGSAAGVDDGIPTLLVEAARKGSRGTSSRSSSVAGCGSATCRNCWTRASTPSTSAVRRGPAGGRGRWTRRRYGSGGTCSTRRRSRACVAGVTGGAGCQVTASRPARCRARRRLRETMERRPPSVVARVPALRAPTAGSWQWGSGRSGPARRAR